MFRNKFLNIFIILAMMIALHLFNAKANTGETGISASVLQMPGGTGWGVIAATPFKTGSIYLYANMKAQAASGVFRGKYHVEASKILGEAGWSIVIFQNGEFKGYTARPSEIGRDSRLGAGMDTPPQKFGDFYVVGRIGIFGVNADEWGPPNAYDVLEQNGFDMTDLEKIPELQTLTPAKKGLLIHGGNRTNIIFQTTWHHPRGFIMPVQIMPALDFTGKGVHQFLASPHINWSLGENWSIQTRIDLELQAHAGEIENEVATYFGGKLSF